MDILTDNPAALVAAAIRALSVGVALLAAGTVLVNTLWMDADAMRASGSPRTALSASVVAVVALLVDWVNTARLLYGDAGSAVDPLIIQSALDTPLGQFYAVALAGLAWLFFATIGARTLPYLAVPGALAVIASVGLVGHTLDEPRALLYALLTLHIGFAAMWMGVLMPLSRLTRQPRNRGYAADLAEDLGRWGFVLLPSIALAAGYLGWLLLGQPTSVPTHAYAQLMLVKVLLFLALVAVGAFNRFVIVPRLHDSLGAGAWLRVTIALEALLFAAILLAVAVTTDNVHPRPLPG